MEKMKVGLALGAGAARGLAHIGVLQVLQEEKIPVDLIAGTSIGSLIGAFYAAGADLYLLEKIAEHLQWKHLTDFTLCKTGLINGKELFDFIKLLTQSKDFSDLNLPFAAVATDIHSGEEVVLQQGLVAQAVRASISIPGVFTPVEINGRFLVDGAVVSNLPVRAARQMGAQVVIGVDVGIDLRANKASNVIEIILQTISIMDWEIAKHRAIEADFIIRPKVGDVATTALHRSQECISLGRAATLEVLPEIRNLLKEKGI